MMIADKYNKESILPTINCSSISAFSLIQLTDIIANIKFSKYHNIEKQTEKMDAIKIALSFIKIFLVNKYNAINQKQLSIGTDITNIFFVSDKLLISCTKLINNLN